MEALLEGTVDIGTSSRNLTQEELEKGAVENIVAMLDAVHEFNGGK